jgi:DNA-binding IclR family transcriptional regulator
MARKLKSPPTRSRGNSTIVTAARLLRVVAGFDGPAALTRIADKAAMSPSRAYRYLRGLEESGLIGQDPTSGLYDLGPEVLELGLAAISRIDPVRYAVAALPALTERTGLVSIISVWGSHGPTVIRCEHANLTAPIRIREGIILPLLFTAAGSIFLAHLPDAMTRPFIARETKEWNAQHKGDKMTKARIEKIRKSVARDGFARTIGLRTPMHANVAAPVFDRDGKLELVITLIGVHGSFDADPKGKPARILRETAEALSRKLGAGANGAKVG